MNVNSQPLAFCGINCDNCPVFLATVKNDFGPLKDFAAHGAKKWNTDQSVFMEMKCWGCQQDEKPRIEHCTNCATRNCARDKGYENCAYCVDFDTCDILQQQNNDAIQPSRINLMALREEKGLD